MSFANRIFSKLEDEILRNLHFCFTVVGGPNRIPALKRFTIKVWARNNGPVPLTDVRGAIRPAKGTSFRAYSFRIARLNASQEVEVGRIEVTRTEALDQVTNIRNTRIEDIAVVNVTGEADLSGFRFRDVARAVRFVQPGQAAIPVEGDPGRGSLCPRKRSAALRRPQRDSSWSTGHCIPLSPVTGDY